MRLDEARTKRVRMKLIDVNYASTGPRLAFTFGALIALILGGNGLIVWQFHTASLQTDRLAGVNQQVIAALRLQESLLSFHQRLDELTRPKDAQQLAKEAEPLRRDFVDRIERTRFVLTQLPSDANLDPAFLPTLDAIEIAMPSQVEAVTSLAESGDWEAVHLRLANELRPLESQTSALIRSIDQDVSGELAQSAANMKRLQREILFIVPTTAVLTFFITAFFGWAVTRRIVELRLEEQVRERTRIARELHDTLLQGVFSASMQFHLAVDRLPADSSARPLFARPMQIIGEVMEEGRNAVRGFRSLERGTQDLERAFSRLPQELNFKEPTDFHVTVEGQTRSLLAVVHDEVYSIGREALVNSFRHSGANRIEVELEYSSGQMRMVVRDDGSGIDPKILESGRDGHWGLTGMRERAARIGAKLKVVSRLEKGTEVELCVPGEIAFDSHSSSHASKWLLGLYDKYAAKATRPAKQRVG
jgi:signal transduction histidine kinase